MLKLLKLLGITQFLKFTQLNFSFGGLVGDLIGGAIGVATGGFGLGLGDALGGALGGSLAGGIQSGNLSGALTGGLAGYGEGSLIGDFTGATSTMATQAPADVSSAAIDYGAGMSGADMAGAGQTMGGVSSSDLASIPSAGADAGSLTWQQKLQQMFTGQNLNPFSSGGAGTGTGKLGTGSSLMSGAGGLMSLYNGYQLNQLSKQLQDPNTGMYQSQLANLVQNPNSYAQTPAYQFQLSQGLEGLGRTSAAGGYGGTGAAPGTGGGSGNYSTAVQQYGQGLAQTGISNQETMLANLSKGNPAAITAASQAGNSNLMGMLMLNNGLRG